SQIRRQVSGRIRGAHLTCSVIPPTEDEVRKSPRRDGLLSVKALCTVAVLFVPTLGFTPLLPMGLGNGLDHLHPRLSGEISSVRGRHGPRTHFPAAVCGEKDGIVKSAASDPADFGEDHRTGPDGEVSVTVDIETIASALEGSGELYGTKLGSNIRVLGRGKSDAGRKEGEIGSGAGVRAATEHRKDNGKKGRKGKPGEPPDKERKSLKKRRARSKAQRDPEKTALLYEVAKNLKARDALRTVAAYKAAVQGGLSLPRNIICGVLNLCVELGDMDDCLEICNEMKDRGMLIEENTYVPLIRGMVNSGDSHGALNLIRDMVLQKVEPRLRCYEPVLSGMFEAEDVAGGLEAWEHMEGQGVIPRIETYVTLFCGLARAGKLWELVRSGKVEEILGTMSYRVR
ncbi:unnamed protein product, partial [Discosporangium mesarthrocarpum]